MKTRGLVAAAFLLAASSSGCMLIPGRGQAALLKVKQIRKMEDTTEKVPLLVEYLGFNAGIFGRERVARAAMDGLVDIGPQVLPYIRAALHEEERGGQARVYLLRSFTRISGAGAARLLLDITRDHDESVYLRAEAINQLAALHWKTARPYLEHLAQDETEPAEVRRAASRALRHL